MKPFMKGDKFLTFINYAGKVTQILYHQFTWVNSQTDWSVISHLSRLRTTHFLRQYFKKKRFWDSFCPNEDKFNLTLFLLRALFFLPFFWLILLLISINLLDTISRICKTRNSFLFTLLVIGLITKKILYKKSTKWSQIKSFCTINIMQEIFIFK